MATVNAGTNGNKDDFLLADGVNNGFTKEFFVGTATNISHTGTYQPFGNNGYIAGVNAWATRRTSAEVLQDMKNNPLPETPGLLYSGVLNDSTAPEFTNSAEESYTISNIVLPSAFEANIRSLITASDNVSGSAYLNLSYSSEAISPLGFYIPGTYTVTYSASDFAHNTASNTFTLEILDESMYVPPVITYDGPPLIVKDVDSTEQSIIDYLNEHITITDNLDASVAPVYSFSAGTFSSNLAVYGYHVITVEAVDSDENVSSITIQLSILEGTDFSTAIDTPSNSKKFQTSYIGELLTIESWINIPASYPSNPGNGGRYGAILTNYMNNDDRDATEGLEIYTDGNIDFYFGGTHHRLLTYDVRGKGWVH
ncbi:MAG: hypothetical protein LBV51_01200, partial [Acholeplasmatales bacterium]|nr:hypothetical protein [Acholeplasmatales bacterium]